MGNPMTTSDLARLKALWDEAVQEVQHVIERERRGESTEAISEALAFRFHPNCGGSHGS